MHHDEHEEIMVLGHEAWPGFRKAFMIVFGLACLYLAIVLFSSVSHHDDSAGSHSEEHHARLVNPAGYDSEICL